MTKKSLFFQKIVKKRTINTLKTHSCVKNVLKRKEVVLWDAEKAEEKASN